MKKKNQINKLIDEIKSLEIQGATSITKNSLTVVREEIEKERIKTMSVLKETFSAIEKARVTEPFIANCFNYLLWQIEKKGISDLKKTLLIFDLLLDRLEIIKEEIISSGLSLVENKFNVFTHCHSTNVEEILKQAQRKGINFRVFLTETRPKFQGRITAENLVNAGIKVTMVTDSAATFLVSVEDKIKIDLIILGCDAIFPDGSCFNKIGSYGISLSAKSAKIPLFVAGSLLKFSPKEISIEERPETEIWEKKPKKLTVLNPAFDKVPASFINGYITEFGIVRPEKIEKMVKSNYPWIINEIQNSRLRQGYGGQAKLKSELGEYPYLYLSENISKEKNIIATFRLESEEKIEQAANELAAESSIGTWTEVKGETEEIFKRLAALIFELDKKTGIIKVAYPLDLFEPGNIPQLLSSVAGNIFGLKKIKWLRLQDLEFPKSYVIDFPGPEIGAEKVRKITGVYHRPLIGCIVKPKMGLSWRDHSKIALEVFEAGVDLVKDDENLTNQEFNPFKKRVVEICQTMKEKGWLGNNKKWEARSGKSFDSELRTVELQDNEVRNEKIYAFNITADTGTMIDRAKFVKANCGNCVMVDILTCGFSGLQYLRKQNLGLIIHGHRAMHGVFTKSQRHGISMLVLAKLARLAGVDTLHTGTVIGKMAGTKEEIIKINNFLLSDWYGLKKTLPVASGGLHPLLIPDLIEILGNDLILNFGGGIHGHPLGLKSGVMAMKQAIEAMKKGVSLEKYAQDHSELRVAVDYWKK